MEMPEGWKKLEFTFKEEFPAGLICLELMKEMAEALEHCRTGEALWSDERDDYIPAYELARMALKKFQEWK